jgi:hypothetical protein
MTDTDEPNMLAELKATLRERGGDRRSPLFQWMYHNHDALLEMFSDVRPNWPRVTAVLTSRGFTAADGQPLRPESVRKLWHKVRRRHGKARAGTKPKPASAPVEQAAPEPASPDDVLARSRLSKQMVRTDAGISDAFGSSTLKAFRPVHSSKLHHLFSRLS